MSRVLKVKRPVGRPRKQPCEDNETQASPMVPPQSESGESGFRNS